MNDDLLDHIPQSFRDPNRIISSHSTNDDMRHFAFERNSRLPLDTFHVPLAERMERIGELILVGMAIIGIIVIFVGRRMGWL